MTVAENRYAGGALFLAAALTICACLLSSGHAAESRWLLAGGHLPACSSYADSACSTVPEWPDDAFSARRHMPDPQAAERWRQAFESRLSEDTLDSVLAIVGRLSQEIDAPLTTGEFVAAFRRSSVDSVDSGGERLARGGEAIYQGLPDRPWDALLDFLEQPAVTEDGDRPSEYVALDASENRAARDLYRRFVAMAAGTGEKRPVVAVSTAASRNPYEALDYYSGLFRQAGAEVVWLPLDAAVRAARDAGECDRLEQWQASELGVFDRARVSPQRFALQQRFCAMPEAGPALIERVDAVFLNGGDQSFTRAAFLSEGGEPTAELAALRRRIDAGELVLGGTSAGTAVQSRQVMISNGSAAAALLKGGVEAPPPPRGCERNDSCPDDRGGATLTWSPGGIGTFPVGVLDTHFTERWRQLRLVQLLAQTGERYGIGIDETTALEAAGDADGMALEMTARGAGSVWVFDLAGASVARSHPLEISGVRLTRLRDGGSVRFERGSGVAFDWPQAQRDSWRRGGQCETVEIDAKLERLLHAPVPDFLCLDAGLGAGRVRLALERVGGRSAVSHFLVDVLVTDGEVGAESSELGQSQ